MSKKYIWLFGENLGETANNNSFYFWFHSLKFDDSIEKYFILSNTEKNRKFVKSFDKKVQKFVVWKNSLKHFKLYFSASMYFVTLSYKDVRPEKFFMKQCNFLTEKPVVYLQHGITAIKQLGYNGNSYNNNMFRFVYYNKYIAEKLININKFKEYQLYYGQYFPRYIELVRRFKKENHNGKKILYFPTWREYFGENFETKIFLHNIKKLITNQKLNQYLQSNNVKITICLHQFFENKFAEILQNEENENIKIVSAKDIDVLNEIAINDVCITDYSSLGFDFTFLNKPVILFQPDREEYLKKRNIYCTLEELEKYSVNTVEELIEIIISEKYSLNEFFRSKFPDEIDYDYIENGGHIERMYKYFHNIQNNNIVFLGYNFFGIGGTVNATLAMAEGLLERGYLVTLMSLKKHANPVDAPCGLNMCSFYNEKSNRKIDILKKIFSFLYRRYGYLNYDTSKKYLWRYCDFGLKKFLKADKFKYYISTRETLHPYLLDAENISDERKYYFFHTQATMIEKVFPQIIYRLKQYNNINNAIFVTKKSEAALQKNFCFNHYKNSLITGNALTSARCITEKEVVYKEITYPIKGMFLLRISKEREDDIKNLIAFAEYLQSKNINYITIDVYGNGDFKNKFLDLILEKELYKIIVYKGEVKNPKPVIPSYDFLIDFSKNQSFGMTYIEAVLNGKMIFCMHNNGSDEVLKEIPDCYYKSFDELLEKIKDLDNLNKNLLKNYKLITKRYSRSVVSGKLVEFLK